MSARYTPTRTTSSSVRPAASSAMATLRITCSVCAATPPSTSSPVTGSLPTCPLKNISSPARTPGENGPGASPSRSVVIASLDIAPSSRFGVPVQCLREPRLPAAAQTSSDQPTYLAAIDLDGGAGDKARPVRCEERDDCRHLAGVAVAAQGNPGGVLLQHLGHAASLARAPR